MTTETAPSPPLTLKDQIAVVVQARSNKAILDQQVKDSREAWEKENSVLLDSQANEREATALAEARLRELTIEDYLFSGNKKPAPGLGIREITKLDYDQKVALTWATEHAICLQLDKKAFEGIVKTSPLPFVTVSTELQATIATELKVVEE